MNALTFRIRLLQPLLASQVLAGEENSAIGLPFVPGSVIRGALIDRYLRRHACPDLAGDPQARALFLDDKVCFLHAYPCPQGQRTLPTPRSWFVEKDSAREAFGECYDWAVDSSREMDLPKNVALPFCHIRHRRGEPGDEEEAGPARPASDVGLYSPPMQVTVHIALENPNVRGEENKLYRYDALAEGQAFAGAIISQDGKGLGELKTLLEGGDLFLGRAHTAGYGRVAVEADEPRDWPEYDPGDNPPKGRLIVTLLSDTILRHANGQVGASAEETLGSVLGLSGKCRKFERLLPAGGFNRKWGLPLAQSWAMHAGSVYVWEAPRADVSALRRAVEMGIGERRAEGFGRVAVNWHTAPALTRFKLEASQPTQAVQLSPRSREQARSMARRQLRRVLEGKLVEKVNQLSIRDAPENAQLSRIRVCALHSQHDNSTQPILEYLKGLRERDAIHQFRRCRIAGVPLDAWIEERAKELDVQQQLLGAGKPPQVAGEEATLTDELRVEYTARLIDAVMKKAIQERRAPQGKPGAGRRPKEGR